MERLRASHVAVFGLGGVGSWCADALARTGVGELTLVDFDTVSASNINRQLFARTSTLGMAKTEAAREWLRDINPDIKVNAPCRKYEAASREEFFTFNYGYIVDAIDLVSSKVDLIVSALERGLPIISALGAGNKLNPNLLRVMDISETSGDGLARVMRRELRKRGITNLTVVSSAEPEAEQRDYGAIAPDMPGESPPPGRRSVPGSVSWVTATAGMLLAWHVVRELTAGS